MTHLPRGRTSLEDRFVEDELVILDRERDAIHQLNPTARFIWSRCDGEHDLDTIAKELAEVFGVDFLITRDDVGATISTLEELGLLAVA